MVVHLCRRCGYTTYRKSNLRDHYSRKNKCSPIISDIGVDECLIDLDCKSFICKYCNRTFSRRYNFSRHEDICQSKQINILKSRLDKLENERVGNINNSGVYVGRDQNNINIQINSYSDTDYSVIKNRVNDCIQDGHFNLEKFIELVHFNEDHPENHNLMITNARENKIMEYNGEKFRIKGKGKKGLEKLLNEFIDKIEMDVDDERIIELTADLIDNYQMANEIRKKDILDGIAYVLYNGKDKIKETHLKKMDEVDQ